MVDKRFKSVAAAELIRKETNAQFINTSTYKIYFKMFTQHLHEKDEWADLELEPSFLDDSSCSYNQLMSKFDSDSGADSELSSSDEHVKKSSSNKPRKKRAGICNITHFNGQKMKAKHRHSSWFFNLC